ncbi:MAG: quinone-dependent dihydroorotate dehydrogenase [Alistipes sp.]|nr:quinone-dependent dihydroorotate dehydrogenase [Alistipes sp.]
MNKSIFQHIIGCLPAETSHNVRLAGLRFVGALPTGRWWLKMALAPRNVNLERNVFGLHFTNPIGIAAGIDPDARCLGEFSAMGFGFVEIGTVTCQPQAGTPRPRLRRLDKTQSLINNTGYPSRGMEYVLDKVRNRDKATRKIVIGCNIGKLTTTQRVDAPKEYLRVFRNMYQYVDFFTINIAANTSAKLYVPRSREEILQLVEPLFEFRRGQQDYRPILVKISPDLSREEIDTVIDILIEAPLDGIEAVSGSFDMNPDSAGAISGAMLTQRAIEIVRYIAKRTDGNYPIIGSGGMMTPDNICDMIEAGASLVALNAGIRENGLRLLKHASRMIADNIDEPSATKHLNPEQ